MRIPDWSADGLLPPIRPKEYGASADRSPYLATTVDLVSRFSGNKARRVVLDGFLSYRSALHAVGLVRGFQWLDGSFLEEIEVIEGRPPNDLDVVSFWELPATAATQADLVANAPYTFQDEKDRFHVDAYHVQLGLPVTEVEVRRIAYWYSMWSHRRSGIWKGFVQVSLDPAGDADARTALALLRQAGGDT